VYDPSMRVYLAAAMTNAARDLDVVQAMRDEIAALGHEVLTPQVAAADGIAQDAHLSFKRLAARDLQLLASSHALVAEVSTPSHGVGIEVLAATRDDIPVLLVHRRGVPVSRLLLGLRGAVRRTYASQRQARAVTAAFLASLRAGE
jgi:2'-deoxynucleoside 5'-phosphate N-hydrolase